ncbi:permease prefix domain 1-containing protein [Vallitalea guaymasensis]|uniref:permease prefix domain 1-containing protein n=1 Tax=Vallitalea guaymasensis TaxID=1185412 RepID=UPI002357F8D1|nr:permease prefix domain 1-containing protein [Vallitalea guaymasensis]
MNSEVQEVDKRIALFLDKVGNQINTEEEALKIKDELIDHIDCLTEELIDMGYSNDEAISKALMQMGDPNEIGYSFTNRDVVRKRNQLIRMLRMLSIGLLIIGCVILFVFTEYSTESLGSVIYFFNILNIVGFSSLTSHTNSKYLMNSEDIPILIIWPVKKHIYVEYIIIGIIFSPILILFGTGLVLGAIEDNTLWKLILLIIIFTSAIISTFLINKLRIPKYIVTNEGLIVLGKFISWTAINNVRWLNSYYKNENTYMLQILDNRGFPITRKIKVSNNQYEMVSSIISERV